jgi:hypothetical protein
LVQQLKQFVVPFKKAPPHAPPTSAFSTDPRTAASALGRGEDAFGGTTKVDTSLLTDHGIEDAAAPFRVQESPELMRAQQRAAEERQRAKNEARKADELARAAEHEATEKTAQAELAGREAADRNAEQRERHLREQAEAKAAEEKRQRESLRRKVEQRKKERSSVFSTLGRKKK